MTWPLREPSLKKLQQEKRRALRSLAPAPMAATWESVGPANIGGRCTCVACDPTNADRIWIGAAGGGVWSSPDGGQSWQQAWPAKNVLQIGALAIDVANPSILYCGTGEANLSADSYPGDGIYRSLDGGAKWDHWADSVKTGVPRRIGAIAIDPFDSRHILVGGVGYGRLAQDNDFGGLYVTADGGKTWSRQTFISKQNYWCHSIVFDPKTKGTVYATFTGAGTANGIYRSTDGGTVWTQLKNGLPAPERMSRTTLVLAPSNPKIVYALAADQASGRQDLALGVFRSANGGNTWSKVGGSYFDKEGQMSYGNTIAVHPLEPNTVLCGGVDLHRSINGGATWQKITKWDAERGAKNYAHADHHALHMPAQRPGRVYSANDGGLDVSEDAGKTWANRSNGLVITMFYDMDIAQSDARVFGGGAQDNGTLVTTTGAANAYFELLGGDGGWMVVDPKDAGRVYASYQYGGMYRFLNGSYKEVSPPFKKEDMDGVWMVFITLDPKDAKTVYTGNQRVYKTVNDGISWSALTPSLDGSAISAIEVASDSKTVYVGTENGGFFRSTDKGATWSADLASALLPGVVLTRIDSHPTKPKELYVTFANFGNSHVFKSVDAGSTWRDMDGGRLPDVPHHALLVRPDVPGELFVCNDVGVYLTRDDGNTWLNCTLNLPNVMVVDLVYHGASRSLYAATYGRSIWRLQL